MAKLIKAHCAKNGKKFLIECDNEDGKLCAINFLNLTESEFEGVKGDSLSGEIQSAKSLLACNVCKSRKIGGCSCAKSKGKCSASEYNFQCLYCNELTIDNPVSAMPRIKVTKPRYDDIGKVLDQMSIPYSKYDGSFDCDILFINCGTADAVSGPMLAEFTKKGGCVYISDLAFNKLQSAYGNEVMKFKTDGKVCEINADICDEELRRIIGDKTKIKFDLPAWAIISDFDQSVYPQSRVILRASGLNAYSGKPIMVTFKYGEGNVFYTSFHNHTQASEKEKALLQLLLLKQIGTQSNQTIEQTASLMGLNISSLKNTFK